MKDAFSQPRRVNPGCQHGLGCGCDIPHHLRPSTPIELFKEARYAKVGKIDEYTDSLPSPPRTEPPPRL